MNLRKHARRLVYIGTVVGLIAIVGGIVVWWMLHPPALNVPTRETLTLRDMTVINPGMERLTGQSVALRDGVIDSIAPGEPGDVPGPYDGLFLLPGLIDMHIHYPPKAALGNQELWSLMFLAHGVTTVRDMGSADGSIFDLRERARAGEMPAPRIFAAGAMLDGAPPAFPSNHVITTAEEARAKVDQQVDLGADFIKVYNMLSEECMRAIRAQADARGVKVVGHVPIDTPIEWGLVNDVQHMTGIPVLSDPERQRKHRADYLIEDVVATDAARIKALIPSFLEHDMAFTPTMINQRMRRKQCGPISDPQDAALGYVPGFWPESWGLLFGTPYTPGDDWEPLFLAGWAKHKEVVRAFHAAGVRVHAGTDTMMPYVVPGKSMHGELEEFVDAGLTPEETWEIATRNAGDYLLDSGLGIIKPGAPADLLIFSEDPTRDLANLDTLVAVIADGRLYSRESLDGYMEQYQAHFRGPLYDTAMKAPVALVRQVYQPN